MLEAAAGSGDSNRAEQRGRVPALWRGVLLPFLAILLLFSAFAGLALSMPLPVQMSLLADSLLTVLVLLPLMLLLFPLLLLSLALVLWMQRTLGGERELLRRLEAETARLERHIDRWLGAVDERVIRLAVRLAPLRALLRLFDAPEAQVDDEVKDV